MPLVTEVRVRALPIKADGLVAFASVTLDGVFTFRDVRLIRNPRDAKERWSLKMPRRGVGLCPSCGDEANRRDPHNGRESDVAHPITHEFRRELTDRVVEAYLGEVARLEALGPADGQRFDQARGYHGYYFTAETT